MCHSYNEMIQRITPLLILLLSYFYGWSFDYKDSLFNVINNSAPANRLNKANALIELSKFYWTNQTDSAISFSHQVILLGEDMDNDKIIGDGYFNLGMIEYVNGSFSSGFNSFEEASEHYKLSGDEFLISQSLYQGGICLRKIGQNLEALAIVQEAFDLVKDSHNNQLAYSLAKELGELYALESDIENADSYFKKSIKIAQFHADSVALIDSYISAGCFYQDISENNKSLNSFYSALKLINPSNKQLLSQLYNFIGEAHLQKNELNEANDFFSLGLLTAKEGNSKLAQSRSHYNLSKIYEIQQKYALALIEYKLFSQINDSINFVLKTQTITGLQAKYDNAHMSKEMHLKDLQVEKSEIDKLESELEVQNQAFQNKLIIRGLVIVLVFGVVLLYAFRKQRKLNIKLDQLSIVAREIENTVIITDREGEIEWMNASYKRNYGLDINQFKEKFGSNILKSSYSDEIALKMDQVLRDKKTVQYFLSIEDVKGSERHLRTTLTPKLNSEKEIEKIILIDTDITDLIQAERQITSQRDEMQSVYNQVKESIDYAQMIQQAVLPHHSKINKFFDENYLFYQPKDVVSGDFYFVEETEKYIYFAGADCTGHGVPGAIMSVICHNFLENSVHKGNEDTDEILRDLNAQIIKKLRQSTDEDEHIKDGLDIALCRLSKADVGSDKRLLQFSGAHSPLYIIDNKELTELKPDRVHLGMPLQNIDSITKQELLVSKGSELVMFSDGFVDQKGEATGKKYYYKPFRELIMEVGVLPSSQKSEHLRKTFAEWKGVKSQADDVFVWGLKI